MNMFSRAAEIELRELAQSEKLKSDMATVARTRHNHLLQNGEVNVDAYTDFVTAFNEFINHQPKPFKRIIDRNMRL
jgi:hypothetical protein